LNKELETLISLPHVSELFLTIYEKEPNLLSKYTTPLFEDTKSKKDQQTRQKELIEYTIGPLVDSFSFDTSKKILDHHHSRLLFLVIKNIFDGRFQVYL
jgi:hypothetical protein